MKNLIVTLCNRRYSPVLNLTIKSIQQYATRVGADLHIAYGGFQLIDKYPPLLALSRLYDKVLFLDCDIYIKSDAPNIFDLHIDDFAFCTTDPENPWTKERLKCLKGMFDDEIDPSYYVRGGVIYGTSDSMSLLSDEVIKLWNKTEKIDPSLYCDQSYLCRVVKKHFPNYRRIEENWCKTLVKVLNGEDYYFAHAYGPIEEKMILFRRYLKNV